MIKRLIVEGWIRGQWICIMNSKLAQNYTIEQIKAVLRESGRTITSIEIDGFGVVLARVI